MSIFSQLKHSFCQLLARTLIVFISVTAVTGLVACQSGSVSIQLASPENKPVAKTDLIKNSSTEDESRINPEIENLDKTAYFVSITSYFDKTTVATGIGFLSSESTVSHPFGFHLSSPRSIFYFSWNPVQFEGEPQIAWIENSPPPLQPHLKIINPRSMKVVDRGEVFSAFTWSISPDAQWILGITEDGKALLQNLNSTTSATLIDKGLSKEAQLFHLPRQKRVAIFDPASSKVELFSSLEPNKIIKSWNSNQFAVSPSGDHLLLSDASGLQNIEPDTGEILNIPGNFKNLKFPQWKDDTTLAFISGPSDSRLLQVINLNTNEINAITPLHLNTQEETLICPAWIGEDLIYANKNENIWKIWKVSAPILKTSLPKILAQPIDSDKGYLCPKGNAS